MATLVTLTREQLIDEALDWLYQAQERPRPVRVGSNNIGGDTDTTFTLHADDFGLVSVTSVLELRQELILVTVKSSDATPVFTGSRGYAGTAAIEGRGTGEELLLSPTYQRGKVARNIARFFEGPANVYLPYKVSAVYNRTADMQYIELPADTMDVLGVKYQNPDTGRFDDLDGPFRFHDDIPIAVIASGKALTVSSAVADDTDIIVVTQEPYAWTEDEAVVHDENDSILVPVGSQDLASLWAAGYTALGRELQRAELDSIEEWNQDEVVRTGVNLRLVAETWRTFYRRVDEARRVHMTPRRREYRRRTRIRLSS